MLDQSPFDFSHNAPAATPRRVSHNPAGVAAHFTAKRLKANSWLGFVCQALAARAPACPLLQLAVHYAVFHTNSFNSEGSNPRITKDKENEFTFHSA